MLPFHLFLLAGAILFSLGVLLVLTRRNAIMALMGIELMLNAANLNFVAFARYHGQLHGQMAALFLIAIAAAEVAVALAIVLNAYKRFGSINIDDISEMKG